MLNSSVQIASSAAITQGRYSGLQPAITALIAIFSTVTSTRSGGTIATTSSGARVVPVSIRSTRSSVGGTTGRPSVKPRSNIDSISSSRSASSMRRAFSTWPSNRARNASTRSGSTLFEPQPGRITGRSSPRCSMPVIRCHSARDQPTVRSISMPFITLITVGTVSISWCQLTDRSASWIGETECGNVGSSWVYTVHSNCASRGATIRQVSHSSFTITTRPSGSTGLVGVTGVVGEVLIRGTRSRGR